MRDSGSEDSGSEDSDAEIRGTYVPSPPNMRMRELGSAIRALKSTPGPVAAAILTLALATGMNAGMVGLVDRALLSPPEQVADPDRVVTLAFERGEGDERSRLISTSYVT